MTCGKIQTERPGLSEVLALGRGLYLSSAEWIPVPAVWAGKLNYGILVEYIPVGDQLYAIAAIVPDAADFIRLVNRFSIVLYAVSLAAAVGLISLFVKHITNRFGRWNTFPGSFPVRNMPFWISVQEMNWKPLQRA